MMKYNYLFQPYVINHENDCQANLIRFRTESVKQGNLSGLMDTARPNANKFALGRAACMILNRN